MAFIEMTDLLIEITDLSGAQPTLTGVVIRRNLGTLNTKGKETYWCLPSATKMQKSQRI